MSRIPDPEIQRHRCDPVDGINPASPSTCYTTSVLGILVNKLHGFNTRT